MAFTIKDARKIIGNANLSDDDIYKIAQGAGFQLDPVEQNTGIGGDTVTDLERGVLQVPGAAVGLADAALGVAGFNRPIDKATDWIGEKTGFQPGKTADLMRYDYSPQRQASDTAIDQAWADPAKTGLDIAGEYLANPRSSIGNVVQSLPAMLAGGLAGRYGLGVQKAAQAVKAGAMTQAEYMALAAKAAGAGEGAIMAGQAMQNIDESVDPQKAGLASLGIGLVGGAIGYGSGRAANAMGIGDIEQAAVTGGAAGFGSAAISPAKRIIAGAIQEGPVEEGLQSVAETGLQNMAEDKPFNEGMARNVAEGSIAGALMGGGINAFSRDNPQAEANPNAGPLEKAANTVAPAQSRTLALPELIFTADGQSIDKAELMRNFLANGVPRREAVEYIRRIGVMPQEERTPVNLDPYRFLQERDAARQQDAEAMAERAAIQNEAQDGREFDDSIPYDEPGAPVARTNPQPDWEEYDLANQLNQEKIQQQQLVARERQNATRNQAPIQTKATRQQAAPDQSVQPAESGISPQVGGTGQADQAPGFVATHTLSDGATPVRFNADENGFEDAQGNIFDPDGYEIPLKEPVNVTSKPVENVNQAASLDEQKPVDRPVLSSNEIASVRKDKGPHYAAGLKSAQEGKGRELPSYFTKPKAKNAQDWLKGYDEYQQTNNQDTLQNVESQNAAPQAVAAGEEVDNKTIPYESLDKNDPLFEKKNLLRRLRNTVNNGTDPQGKPLMGTALEASYKKSIAELEGEIERRSNTQPTNGAAPAENSESELNKKHESAQEKVFKLFRNLKDGYEKGNQQYDETGNSRILRDVRKHALSQLKQITDRDSAVRIADYLLEDGNIANELAWIDNGDIESAVSNLASKTAEQAAPKPVSDQIAEAGTRQGVSKGGVLSIPDSGDLFSPDDPKIIAALSRVSAELPDVSTEEQYVDKNGTTATRKTIVAKSKADMDAKLGEWVPVRNGFFVRAYNGGEATGPTIEIRAPNGAEVSKRLVNGEIATSVSGTLDQIFSGEAVSIFGDYFKDAKKLGRGAPKPISDQIAENSESQLNKTGDQSSSGQATNHTKAERYNENGTRLSRLKYRKIGQLENKIATLEDAQNKLNETSSGVPGSFVTGRSNQSQSLMNRRAGLNDKMASNFAELQKAKADLKALNEWAKAFEAGEVHDNGQPRADAPSKQEAKKSEGAYADYIRARVKPGDTVTFNPNPAYGGIKIKSLNQKTVTVESGEKYSYFDIAPNIDGRDMTRDELKADIKAWREQQEKPPTVSNNDEGLQKPEAPVTDNAKQAEPATASNQKQSGDSVADNERAGSTKELEYKGVRIYPVKMKSGDYVAVETDENKERRLTGDRNRGGDSLHKTIDEAKREVDLQEKRKAQDNERNLRQKEADDNEAAVISERQDIDGFLDDAKPITKGLAVKALNKQINHKGKATTVKQLVRDKITAGEQTSTEQEDKIKPMSRIAYFRADNKQQSEHDRKVKEAGKKTVYYVGNTDLGKLAYDYANYLINNGLYNVPEMSFGNIKNEKTTQAKQGSLADREEASREADRLRFDESANDNSDQMQKQDETEGSGLEDLFKSFGKQGFKKGSDAKLDGNPKADLIRSIQNHWLDVLMDHGFEQDKPNGLKGKLSQSILMNGC